MNTTMISMNQAGGCTALSAGTTAAAAGTALSVAPENSGGPGVSAFASLLLGLLPSGNSETGANPLLSLALPASAAAANIPAAETETESEAEALAALLDQLDQLAQMIRSMPAEWQQQLASSTSAQHWVGAANVELAIATGDLSALAQPSANGRQTALTDGAGNETADAFLAVLARLSAALELDGENTQLRQMAADAKKAVGEFLSSVQTAASAGASPADATALLLNGSADSLSKRSASDVTREIAAVLLKQMNGKLSGETEKKSGQPAVSAQSSHLAAMESKFAFVRLSVISEAGQSAGSELTASGESKPLTEGSHFATMLGDAGKAASAESLQKAESLPQRMNAAAFAEEMTEWMLKQAVSGRNGSITEAKITLMPEHLGQLEVKLSIQNGQLVALFNTESAMARDVLETNLSMLRTNLQNQGVQVEKLEVTHQTMQGSGLFQDGKQRQGTERDSRQAKQRSVDGIEEWADAFGLRLEETEGEHVRMYGSSFHATA